MNDMDEFSKSEEEIYRQRKDKLEELLQQKNSVLLPSYERTSFIREIREQHKEIETGTHTDIKVRITGRFYQYQLRFTDCLSLGMTHAKIIVLEIVFLFQYIDRERLLHVTVVLPKAQLNLTNPLGFCSAILLGTHSCFSVIDIQQIGKTKQVLLPLRWVLAICLKNRF